VLGRAVDGLEKFHGLPLMSIIVEPAKVLFLNNAINHGVFTPLGTAEVADYGRSILFMIESNPGPGTGLLLAYIFFNKGDNRRNAIGALPIHLLGGIHEVYFPFVILMPILIIPLVLAGATGVALEQILGGGLQAPASPGSIIMEYIMTPNNLAGHNQLPGTLINYYPGSTYIANTAGMFGAVTVSFIGSALCFKFKKSTKTLQESQTTTQAMKAESKGLMSRDNLIDINLIVFACDAGMGSSAMGSTKLKKMLRENNVNDVDVIHKSVSEVPKDAKLIVVHESLKHQVAQKNPNAQIVTIKNFMNAPEYGMIVDKLKNNKSVVNVQRNEDKNNDINIDGSELLSKNCIQINCPPETVEQAIKRVGQLMLQADTIQPEYISGMIKRDQDVSVAIGNFIAIPHAPNDDQKYIKKNSLAVATYEKPID
jgi:PTS system mannitol-specific IIC component